MSEWLTFGKLVDTMKPGDEVEMHDDEIFARVTDTGDLKWHNGCALVTASKRNLNSKWRILPQYVTFEEAIKALKNGKTVLYYPEGQDEPVGVEAYLWISNLGTRATWEDLIEGKWTIKQ